MAKTKAVETWVWHPATDTRFLKDGKLLKYYESDEFNVFPGATHCVKNYNFKNGETYRWVIPAEPALAKILKKLGRQTFQASPGFDAASISGGQPLPNGGYNMQPNFPVTDVRMKVRYERRK